MSLIAVLDNLFLRPLLEIYASLFETLLAVIGSPGWSLVAFSVALNLVLLPIYYQMERAGRTDAARRSEMEAEVARMKANFYGRERYFYIRTVHRHYNYSPLSVLFTSADLFLQIGVFITVFRFIAGLSSLSGVAFYGIPDLSRPDGLLFGVNVLPILMTASNIFSAAAYSANPSKRRQAYLFAAVFLVLLYNSPSGLVLYWTANNLFSLVRNIVDRKLLPILPASVRRRAKEKCMPTSTSYSCSR